MRPQPLSADERVAGPTDPRLERTIPMLIAIAVTIAGAAVVIVGALVASGSSRTSADEWMLHGPHSLH